MAVPDRVEQLNKQDVVTGIDFVRVHPTQVTLDVFFHRPPLTLADPLNSVANPIAAADVHIEGGERITGIQVTAVAWAVFDGHDALRLTVDRPGDFSIYTLFIDDARIDRYFNRVAFSFKANCPSTLDCKEPDHECPPEEIDDPQIDYTARDWRSYRQALIDFATARHPRWQDRLEADAGMMFLETVAALADDLSYTKDRYFREAFLETATQRRSVRRLAGLVDYQIHDGLGASTWLDFRVSAMSTISAGTAVTDTSGRIQFEVGRGFVDSWAIAPTLPKTFPVRSTLNSLAPHIWDEDNLCLPVGSTELYLEGALTASIAFDDFPSGRPPGKWMLLQTSPVSADIPARAWMIRVIAREDTFDPVTNAPGPPVAITRIEWEAAQETPFELDLTVLTIHGNLLPATAGKRMDAEFTIGPSANPLRPSAIEREGPDTLPGEAGEASVSYLFSLAGSEIDNLVWLHPVTAAGDPRDALPEVRLTEIDNLGVPVPNSVWSWTRALLGVRSAQSQDAVFTLDDGTWDRVIGFHRPGAEIVHRDYRIDAGFTIRFGNGEFGRIPEVPTLFRATYRLGHGAEDNVAAGTLTICKDPIVLSVSNPLPASNGLAPEPIDDVRQFAPEAFKSVTFRAVRPEDYAEAAERLAWVQRAGASFRWTGSWLTTYVTPDPRGATAVSEPQRTELRAQLDRFRQAGRPAFELSPVYANLDLRIDICVEPFAYRGEVEAMVLEALFGRSGLRRAEGFFSPDRFSFGTPLERSQLESTIQQVHGVRAVEAVYIRRRGWHAERLFSELTYSVAAGEVIRVENNRLFPERGSVRLKFQGGA